MYTYIVNVSLKPLTGTNFCVLLPCLPHVKQLTNTNFCEKYTLPFLKKNGKKKQTSQNQDKKKEEREK